MNNNDEFWTGKRFSRLEVIGFERKKGKERGWNWVVKCDCGNIKTVNPGDVKAGKTRSCGCYHDERCRERASKFKNLVKDNKRLYGIYNGIKKRCYNENEPRYKDYGLRGITMCDEWLDKESGFDKFVEWALSSGYEDGLTIDRVDVDGNYSPDNCAWISNSEQQRNKRQTLWVEYGGEKVRLIDLCERLEVSYDTVHDRIYKRGWPVDRAVSEKSERKNSLMSKCKAAGINYGTVLSRINKFGWSEEEAINTPSAGRGAHKKTYKRK